MATADQSASTYLKLAKINQEQLWKRRQIEWKINLLLWSALAVVGGFVYKEASVITLGIWWTLCATYVLIAVFHQLFLIAYYVSDEKDLEWMIYFTRMAEVAVGTKMSAPARPGPMKTRYRPDRTTLKKYAAELATVFVTFAIAAITLILLFSKING